MEEGKLKFGINVDKQINRMWSIGMCLSHCCGETYLFINVFKWSISIGKIYVYDKDERN